MKGKTYVSPSVICLEYSRSDVMLVSGVVEFNPDWIEEEVII